MGQSMKDEGGATGTCLENQGETLLHGHCSETDRTRHSGEEPAKLRDQINLTEERFTLNYPHPPTPRHPLHTQKAHPSFTHMLLPSFPPLSLLNPHPCATSETEVKSETVIPRNIPAKSQNPTPPLSQTPSPHLRTHSHTHTCTYPHARPNLPL